MKRQAGFTLMELLMAVAIIGIISSIAYPSYQSQMLQSRRADASNALLRMAIRQELFYGANRAYSGVVTNIGGAASTTDTERHYTLSTAITAGGFTLTAVPFAGGGGLPASTQLADTPCLIMTLNQAGQRLPAVCW